MIFFLVKLSRKIIFKRSKICDINKYRGVCIITNNSPWNVSPFHFLEFSTFPFLQGPREFNIFEGESSCASFSSFEAVSFESHSQFIFQFQFNSTFHLTQLVTIFPVGCFCLNHNLFLRGIPLQKSIHNKFTLFLI